VRYCRDDLSLTARRVWYKVPTTSAPAYVHHWQAAKYDAWTPPTQLGEVAQSKAPYGGQAPYLLRTPGLGCGTPEEQEFGILASKPPAVIDPNTGAPVCCGPAIPLGLGGEAEGGTCAVAGGPTGLLLQEDLFRVMQENGGGILVT
jgi:hypothetical protein